jgi:hypothetical protein
MDISVFSRNILFGVFIGLGHVVLVDVELE